MPTADSCWGDEFSSWFIPTIILTNGCSAIPWVWSSEKTFSPFTTQIDQKICKSSSAGSFLLNYAFDFSLSSHSSLIGKTHADLCLEIYLTKYPVASLTVSSFHKTLEYNSAKFCHFMIGIAFSPFYSFFLISIWGLTRMTFTAHISTSDLCTEF